MANFAGFEDVAIGLVIMHVRNAPNIQNCLIENPSSLTKFPTLLTPRHPLHEPTCNESLAKVEKAGSKRRQLEGWPTNSAVFSLAFVRGRVGQQKDLNILPGKSTTRDVECVSAWVLLYYLHSKSDDN